MGRWRIMRGRQWRQGRGRGRGRSTSTTCTLTQSGSRAGIFCEGDYEARLNALRGRIVIFLLLSYVPIAIACSWTSTNKRPDTVALNAKWKNAVAYARTELEKAFTAIEEIEDIMPRHDMDVLEQLTHLNKLSASDVSWIEEARALGDLVAEDRARTRRRGLSFSDSPRDSTGAYVTYIRTVLSAAAKDPVAFDAARIHAAKLMSDNRPLCYELKSFACGFLRNEVARPVDKKPKLHTARNAILHALIFDLANRFAVKPTKNRASTGQISACDILAEAMPKKADLPKSSSALERIWFEGEKAWEARISL